MSANVLGVRLDTNPLIRVRLEMAHFEMRGGVSSSQNTVNLQTFPCIIDASSSHRDSVTSPLPLCPGGMHIPRPEMTYDLHRAELTSPIHCAHGH